MAQMIAKPQSATAWDRAIAGPAAALHAARAFILRFGWPLLLWRVAWAPWWILANRPPPDLPVHAVALPADLDAPGRHVVRTLDRLRGRIQIAWMIACLIRGLALGALVTIGWLLLALAFGLPRPSIVPAIAVAVVLAVAGVVFAACSRPSRSRLARMLDRTYLLDERLATAVESLERPSTSPFGRQIDTVQRADAANQLVILHPYVSRGSLIAWRELGFLLTGLALFGALAFASARPSAVPQAESGVIPAFVPASDRLASLPQNQAAPMNGPMPQLDKGAGNALLGDLNQLGNALDKNPSTQPAAKAIQAGNYPQAASSLQSSATTANQMSPDQRNALANQLDRSADQMSGQNQDLQNATRNAANGLRQGGDQAQQGMSDLANSVSKAAGQAPQPAQSGQSASQPSQGAPAGAADQQQQSGANQNQPNGQQAQNGQAQSGDQQQAQQSGNGTQAQSGTSPNPPSDAQQSGAQAGENQGSQQGNNSAAQQGQSGSQAGDQSQAAGQTAAGDHPEESAGGQPGPGVSQPNQEPQTGQSDSGAGAGAGSKTEPNGGNGKQAPGQQTNQTGSNSAPQQSKGAKPPANGGASSGKDQKGAQGAGSESVALGGSSDQMVQAGQDPASSSQGSGANAGAAQGDAQQGTVGPSGPDSNRVPAGYRGIVSNYFDNNQP
jgi:hypothetical protein